MGLNLAGILGRTNFSAFDWGIVVVYLAFSLVIGLMVRKYVKNMADYVVAGRGLGTALGVATLTGTEMGLVTIMYNAEMGFNAGFAAFHIALIACVVTFIVGVTGFFIYKLRAMKVLTIPEFYGRRFGRKVRVLGGIMLTFGGVLNMGLFLRVGSQFIVGITGMPETGWALPVVMTSLLALVLVYTILGGMISVVITDYVQFVVLSFGILLGVGLVIHHVGWNNIFETVANLKGGKGYDPTSPASGFGIEYILWQVFVAGLVGCAIWPTAVARALAAESPRTVKKQFAWASVSYMIRVMVPCFLGICAFVFIMTMAPDLKEQFTPAAEGAKANKSALEAMPVFLGRILPIGLIGLLTAAMIAAFMSTHDSYLLCWSAVITQDIVAPLTGNRMSTKARIRLTRVLIVVIGLYILYWGLAYTGSEAIWNYMGVSGGIYYVGAFVLLLAGLYWKRASSTGAVVALLTSCLMVFGLTPVQKAVTALFGWTVSGKAVTFEDLAKAHGYTTISNARVSAWLCLGCAALATVLMVVCSLLFPDKKKTSAETEGGAR